MSSNGSVKFNPATVAAITAREWAEYQKARRRQDLRQVAVTVARVAESCPEAWGHPQEPKTYSARPYKPDWTQHILKPFNDAQAAITDGVMREENGRMVDSRPRLDIEFDWSKLTGDVVSDFFAAGIRGDLEAMADILAQVVKKCPKEWGKPNSRDTYLDVDYAGTFSRIQTQFGEDMRTDEKN